MARRAVAVAVALLAALPAACGAGTATEPPSAGPWAPAYPAAALGPFAAGPDQVTVLPRGAVAFPVIAALVAAARRTVVVEMYELQRGDLVDALVAARVRGVAVTVVTDMTAAGTPASAARLRAGGVDVVEYPVRRMTIDHVKLLVVDADAAVVGGINWGTASDAHHDFDVLLRGPAVSNLLRIVARDLIASGRGGPIPPTRPDPAVMVVSTLPFDEVRPLILAAIEGARARIDAELYVVTDVGIVHALERAAARGVAVRVLLDPSERPSDPAAMALRAAGVPVRLFASTGEKLHAKAVVVDEGTVIFGSANWSAGGFTRNHEIDIAIAAAPAVAAAFRMAMDADWATSA